MTRFAFIDSDRAYRDVTVLCRLLKVSRSGFDAWPGQRPLERSRTGPHRPDPGWLRQGPSVSEVRGSA